MNYLGKPLSDYSLLQLQNILASFDIMLSDRQEASKHEKFNKDRQIGNRKIKKLAFPPPGAGFCEIKTAIEEEIKSR
jgi:hypothetical protein